MFTVNSAAIAFLLPLIFALTVAAEEFVEKRYEAGVDEDGVQRVEIEAGEYYYDPNFIVVKVGVPVELSIRDVGGIASHDIAIEAPEAGIDFSEDFGSEPVTIRFTPTRVGEYQFECTKRFLFFRSHKDRGMHGTIKVVE